MPLTLSDVATLARESGAPRLSVYARLASPGEDRHKSEIALRNACDAARARLQEAGEGARADAMVAPLEALLADPAVSRERKHGMAAFLSPEGARIEWVGALAGEGAWADDRFRLSPVWPALREAEPLFALVVSEGGATLYDLAGGGLRPTRAPDMPGELDDLLKFKVFDPQTEPKNRGPDGKVYAGHGESREQEVKEERENYAAAIMKAVEARLGGSGVPLVIVADEEMQGLLRARARYADLVEAGETRHPKTLDEAALIAAVRDCARPLREAREAEAGARIDQAVGRGGEGSEDADAIVSAAREGRVDTLLFAPRVAARAAPDDPAAAKIDRALAFTLASGGAAIATEDERRPLRALFRY